MGTAPSSPISSSDDIEDVQYVYIIRHGDRWDYENRDEWKSSRSGDPPLSRLGHLQARDTGRFLNQLFTTGATRFKKTTTAAVDSEENASTDQEEGTTVIALSDITFLASPFLRTIQTCNEIIDQLDDVPKGSLEKLSQVSIKPEYSVFEWDGHGGEWHACLPDSMEERFWYFPRVDPHHSSLFVPDIPEPKDQFQSRCTKVMEELSARYADCRRYPVLVVVSHAAGCIGLCAAATGQGYEAVTPAAPCSVFQLTRRQRRDGTTSPWTLPPPDAALNGHTDHLQDVGGHTVPWNNFGDKAVRKGYTGPPNSRFAPPPAE